MTQCITYPKGQPILRCVCGCALMVRGSRGSAYSRPEEERRQGGEESKHPTRWNAQISDLRSEHQSVGERIVMNTKRRKGTTYNVREFWRITGHCPKCRRFFDFQASHSAEELVRQTGDIYWHQSFRILT